MQYLTSLICLIGGMTNKHKLELGIKASTKILEELLSALSLLF